MYSKIKTMQRYGKTFRFIEADVTLKIIVSIKDDIDEVSEREAIGMVQNQLDYYSGSNDGSELLANITDEQIKIK